MVEFTGERIHADDEAFRPDVSQHLAAYHACLPFVENKVVLDAGCGDGGATGRLAASARVVIGVDRAWRAMTGVSLERPENLYLSSGDVGELPIRDAVIDVVCSFQVLEHLDRPDELLRETTRVLRPGGLFVLTTPNRLSSFSDNPYHVHEYDPGELRELVEPFFSSVKILGVFGNDRISTLQESRRRHVRAILAIDPFGLRRALPLAVRKHAFAMLARWVRARIRSEHPESFEAAAVSDYAVGKSGVERSLDLLAICQK